MVWCVMKRERSKRVGTELLCRGTELEKVTPAREQSARVEQESEEVTIDKRNLSPGNERDKCTARPVDVTTTMFVPASTDSLLFKLLNEKETQISKKFDWSVKMLEQAGVPLLNKFIYKFPILDGCPKGANCTLCDNDTLKCSTKGAIYRAFCVTLLVLRKPKPHLPFRIHFFL